MAKIAKHVNGSAASYISTFVIHDSRLVIDAHSLTWGSRVSRGMQAVSGVETRHETSVSREWMLLSGSAWKFSSGLNNHRESKKIVLDSEIYDFHASTQHSTAQHSTLTLTHTPFSLRRRRAGKAWFKPA